MFKNIGCALKPYRYKLDNYIFKYSHMIRGFVEYRQKTESKASYEKWEDNLVIKL